MIYNTAGVCSYVYIYIYTFSIIIMDFVWGFASTVMILNDRRREFYSDGGPPGKTGLVHRPPSSDYPYTQTYGASVLDINDGG